MATVEWVVQPIRLSLGGSRATAGISGQFLSGPQRDVQSFEITFMDNLYFPIDLARLSSTVGASGSREPANFRCESTNVFILEAYMVTVTRWHILCCIIIIHVMWCRCLVKKPNSESRLLQNTWKCKKYKYNIEQNRSFNLCVWCWQ